MKDKPNKKSMRSRQSEKKRIIVIVGMHRSGTSSITRGLQVIGVELGNNLMPPSEDNLKGYFEDVDFNQFNIEIFNHLGHDWQSLFPISESELGLAEFRESAKQLIRQKTHHSLHFGLKDPRAARLLPFWHSVFTELDLKISYILSIRNPMSILESLRKRAGFPLE